MRRAEGTGRGIALEDLQGIRGRIRATRSQRGALHSWAFAQIKQLIIYKAALAGMPVDAEVDPRNTSRQCPRCGHTSKRKRPSQARFRCVECGHHGHADHIAASNIAGRAAVNRPNVPKMITTVRVAQGQAHGFSRGSLTAVSAPSRRAVRDLPARGPGRLPPQPRRQAPPRRALQSEAAQDLTPTPVTAQ